MCLGLLFPCTMTAEKDVVLPKKDQIDTLHIKNHFYIYF